jgi:hypothetical protein
MHLDGYPYAAATSATAARSGRTASIRVGAWLAPPCAAPKITAPTMAAASAKPTAQPATSALIPGSRARSDPQCRCSTTVTVICTSEGAFASAPERPSVFSCAIDSSIARQASVRAATIASSVPSGVTPQAVAFLGVDRFTPWGPTARRTRGGRSSSAARYEGEGELDVEHEDPRPGRSSRCGSGAARQRWGGLGDARPDSIQRVKRRGRYWLSEF